VNHNEVMAAVYDDEAEATGWCGPEVLFGLTYAYVEPGQSMLDIGTGTGLASVLFRKAGLKIHGMDISPKMLDRCRSKGFTNLLLHDLTQKPYPYDSGSMDLVVCAGVFNFFKDLSTAFDETARILRNGGLFSFVVGTRAENEANKITIEDAYSMPNHTVTMYLHSPEQINHLIENDKFRIERSLLFTIHMDREQTKNLQARAYLLIKK
jgi:predicted TPR repeat methyltransferase